MNRTRAEAETTTQDRVYLRAYTAGRNTQSLILGPAGGGPAMNVRTDMRLVGV